MVLVLMLVQPRSSDKKMYGSARPDHVKSRKNVYFSTLVTVLYLFSKIAFWEEISPGVCKRNTDQGQRVYVTLRENCPIFKPVKNFHFQKT